MIRLYSYALSPYAAKVHCFLDFKQLEYELFYVHPARVATELPVGHQVPVLEIDGEVRNDSTPIGLWLDEKYPQGRRLLPSAENARRDVLQIDHWISEVFVPIVFRLMLAIGESPVAKVRNRRRGAQVANVTIAGGIPFLVRLFYPLLITRPRFIQQLIRSTDLKQSNRQLLDGLFGAFIHRLGAGPFLGGQPTPTLADLSAYAQFALPYLAGYDQADAFIQEERITQWYRRIQSVLEGSKPLLPLSCQTRRSAL